MANPKGNPQNLKPFKKGNTASVGKGRPPQIPDLRALLCKVLGEEKQGMTAAEAILRAQVVKAIKGDTRAAEWLVEQGYGKVTQKMKITGSLGIKEMSEDELKQFIADLTK